MHGLDLDQFERGKVLAAARPANGQLRQIVENVTGMLKVDHEHQHFLCAVGVVIAQAILADIGQIGADGRTEQVYGVIQLAHFIHRVRVGLFEQLQDLIEHQ